MRSEPNVLRFTGYLDIARYPEFRAAFHAVDPQIPILVDLRDATGVDSTFLSELLLLKRRHRPGLAVLIAPDGHVAKLFAIASVGAKMNVYTTREEALASLSPRGEEVT